MGFDMANSINANTAAYLSFVTLRESRVLLRRMSMTIMSKLSIESGFEPGTFK